MSDKRQDYISWDLKNGIFGLEMLDFAYFRLDF